MPDFRPNCLVVLKLRLDEGRRTNDFPVPRNVEKPPGGTNPGQPTEVQPAPTLATKSPPEARRAQTQAKLAQGQRASRQPEEVNTRERRQLELNADDLQTQTTGLPDALGRSRREVETVDLTIRPRSVKFERPSIQDAGTASITFDYQSLPIDPRSLRSAGVFILLGEINAEVWAEGIARQVLQRNNVNGFDSDLSRAPSTSELPLDFGLSRFEGFVDTWEINFSESANTVTLTCRDLSAVLRDTRVPLGTQLDLRKPIVEGVRELIDRFAGPKSFPVVFGPAIPLSRDDLADIYAGRGVGAGPTPFDTLQKLQKSKKGDQAKQKRKGSEAQTLWDTIVTTTLKLGIQPVVRGRVLFLQEPQAQFRAAEPLLAFYGETLTELAFTKKYEGVSNDTIEVRSPDPSIGRTRWARFPVLNGEPTNGILGDPNSPQPKTSRDSKVTPSGTRSERVTVIQVAGVADGETLENIARQTFEQISRQEIQGSFTTKDIEIRQVRTRAITADDPRGDFLPQGVERAGAATLAQVNILEVFPGDAVVTLVAEATEIANALASEVTIYQNDFQRLTAEDISKRQQTLERLGLGKIAASRLAAAAQNIPNLNKFQVHGVSVTWEAETGLEVMIGFQNFVSLRDEPAADAVSARQIQTTLFPQIDAFLERSGQ